MTRFPPFFHGINRRGRGNTMKRTTGLDDDTRDKTREKFKEQTANNQYDKRIAEREREPARRAASGKKFCKNKYYGYDPVDIACQACSQSSDCELNSHKRFQTIADQLQELFFYDDECFDPEYWKKAFYNIDVDKIEWTEELNLDEKRKCIFRYVEKIIVWVGKNPELFYKVKEIPKVTNDTLDALVFEWKQFRQQKYVMPRTHVFTGLAKIYEDAKDIVFQRYGTSDNINELWASCDDDDYLQKNVVTGLCKELQEYCAQLKETFPEYFGKTKREETWPAKWMTNDKGIRLMLNRCKHFSPIMNVMWKRRNELGYQGSLNLGEKLGINDDEGLCIVNGKEKHRALLPETLTFEVIAKEIGKSAQLVQKYIKAMCDIGILFQFRKYGPGGFTALSIGYWEVARFKKGDATVKTDRVMPYLQQKKCGKKDSPEMYQRLIDFKVDFNTGE
jgi:hypothetical protein